MSIVVDPTKRQFPISREVIKRKAGEMLGEIEARDAYMYEGKEGVKILLKGGRIDILPGSLHLWCKVDERVVRFVDWLLPECYNVG